ncbi:hypothetical protein AMJ49_01215 [Parcubacteria bacterium DG_74_2]|nr:MAG: hypothetical protein AMJ49_01215 [Parcubacteria bacterium DG_74_2]
MKKDQSIVGSLINFRGLVYSPVNEQGVVFLFGRILDDLNMYIEEVRTKYPDCVARRYTGRGWERVYIEFEYLSSNFIEHRHDPKECDIIVCWEDDLTAEDKMKIQDVEIIELKSIINTPQVPNRGIEAPSKIGSLEQKYDLEHHYKRKKVKKGIQNLYEKLDKEILKINDEIFNKYAKTAITYYSPERNFVYLKFRQKSMELDIYTNQQKIPGVKNIRFHENWGKIRIERESDLKVAIAAIKRSYKLMRQAVEGNINTGWYAVTPKEKLTWLAKAKEEK